ncbi:hypothetical protein E2562_028461 [Oryza meyeriana var. granulata]|uniref:Mitochondrial glycoprotein n=1 Tax=Oryza meyeriana var. granulata TaxID=110450 RepID=A0A6G1E5E8_9ORYZ|nr:hypothetical protein E2562_028461 [Oryza meyeriana var. granulata]
MLRRAAPSVAAAASPILRHALSTSSSSSSAAATAVASSSAVNSILLRSLKEHYLEVSKMSPPPKISPPKPYMILKGALDQASGPVLRRGYGEAGEEISISVARLANIMPPGADYDSDDDAGGGGGASESINQLFLHVDISRPGSSKSLQFLCGLYPDAVGIHSVCLRSKTAESGTAALAAKGGGGYQGRIFQELDENVRDAFHHYIEARGINEKLFPFLQAWLYVKDHRNLVHWFKSVGTFISEPKSE